MSKLNYTELKQKSIDYCPLDLINRLGFEKAVTIARYMLVNEEWDGSLQEYAINILEELRQKYPEEWDTNWKYDALLGYAYHIILKYDERYAAYKRAFNKIHPPPPQLLVAMARCSITPGSPPITEEEAISFVQQAIRNTPYIEAIELLRGLYKSTGNIKEQQHWEKILENIKETGPHLPPLDQFDT